MSEGISDSDPMSFADLDGFTDTAGPGDLDEKDMTPLDMLPPAEENHSGIVTISSLEMADRKGKADAQMAEEKAAREAEEAEMEKMIQEQQALHALYSHLLEATNLFTDPLVPKKKEAGTESAENVDVLADSEKLRLWISVFMHQVKDVLIENNISSKSNLVKLIDGIEQEFETVLTFGQRYGSLDSDMVKEKIGNLARVLTNVSTAILTHRNENAPWADFDAYMPELLGVVAVDMNDLQQLNMELAAGSTHEEIMNVLPELKAKLDKSAEYKQAKLDQYSEGDLSIYAINEEKKAWLEAQPKLNKLKRAAPKKVE
jgi:hypothetical protein